MRSASPYPGRVTGGGQVLHLPGLLEPGHKDVELTFYLMDGFWLVLSAGSWLLVPPLTIVNPHKHQLSLTRQRNRSPTPYFCIIQNDVCINWLVKLKRRHRKVSGLKEISNAC